MNLIFGALAAVLVFTLYWMAINVAGKKDSMSERVRRLPLEVFECFLYKLRPVFAFGVFTDKADDGRS